MTGSRRRSSTWAGGRSMHRDRPEAVALGEKQNSELSTANARGIDQHGVEHRISSPGELLITPNTSGSPSAVPATR